MRGGVAWQSALVHGDAGPGEALHVGHGRVVIEVGTVDALFADDAEDAVRCWVIGHAGRDWRDFVKAAFVIYGDALLVRRDHEKQWAGGRGGLPGLLPWSSPSGGGVSVQKLRPQLQRPQTPRTQPAQIEAKGGQHANR